DGFEVLLERGMETVVHQTSSTVKVPFMPCSG
ncbi:MAG: hypothetical protein QOG87_3909, partial [Actinomycetota bacterium]